jgi:flagellar basal body-associated protein FliL
MADPEKKPTPDAAPAAAAKKPEPPAKEPAKEAAKEPAKEPAKEAPKEGGEEAAAAAAKPAAPPAPSSPLWILITIVISLILMPIAGWGIARQILLPRIKAVRLDAAAGAPAGGEEGKKEGAPDKGERGGGGEKGPANFMITDLIVNVANTRGTRFLRAAIEFDAQPSVLTELAKRKAQVTDTITTALSSKRLDELEASDSRQKLRTEILMLVNSIVKSGQVSNIYFTELVIQ